MAEPSLGLLSRLGSPVGSHARRAGAWFTAGPWAVLVATLAWLLLYARQLPCRQTEVGNTPNAFYRLCYSDISVLYQARELGKGANPYALEYPVLTGSLIDITRLVAGWLGAPLGSDVAGQAAVDGANIFFAVTAVLLFGCFLVTVLAQVTINPHRPFDALMVAGAPVVLASALINWDLFCVALAATGLWCWSRRMPVLAGLFLGLGVAAKLYPVLLLVPLLALCLRAGRMGALLRVVAGALVGWAIPNGALAAVNRPAWLQFWTFNAERSSDLGSLWYVLELLGQKVPAVSGLVAALSVLGALGIVTLALLAPRRPRLGQLAFLMVCWFLMVNKVYSPQYVLWLLPLVVLARPVWRDWAWWQAAELAYFAAIWGHLAGTLTMPGVGVDRIYAAAVIVRLLAQAALAALVVRDILSPRHDVVRHGGLDDPIGGELDGAPDAGWLPTFVDGLLGRRGAADPDAANTAADPDAANTAARPFPEEHR